MSLVKRIFGVEWRHILVLPAKTRGLLVSYSLREAASPLFDIFVNAFLWRAHQSALLIAAYNIGMFIGLPLGFILNGILLRDHLKATHLYFMGAFTQGLILGFLVFLSPGSMQAIFASGLVYGFASGVYWANRNFLTVEYTHDSTNNYFFGLSAAIASVTGIVIPAAAGWLIAAGPASGLYAPEAVYKGLMITALIILFFCGRVIYKKNYPVPRAKALFIRRPDRLWQGVRGTAVLMGFLSGTNAFIPVILVLAFIGNEGVLGTIKAVVTFGTALVLYFIGRMTPPGARVAVMGSGVGVLVAAALIFGAAGTPGAALLYVVISGLAMSLINVSYSPFFNREVGAEGGRPLHYARVVDHEVFLNAGRIAGSALFVLILSSFDLTTSMRIVLPVIAAMQIGLVLLVRHLVRTTPMSPRLPPRQHMLAKVHKAPVEA